MRRFTICLFLTSAGMGSCGVIGQSTKSTGRSGTLTHIANSLQRTEEKTDTERFTLLTFSSDSSQMQYSVQIWPRGNFRFSADSGFIGEAEHILMTGRTNTSFNNAQSLTADRQNRDKLVNNILQNVKIKTARQSTVKKSALNYKWIIGIVVMMLTFAGFYLFRKRIL